MTKPDVYLLDYGAGNVRSVRNAIKALGYKVKNITCEQDFENAQFLIFPGVGNMQRAMEFLNRMNYIDALKKYIKQDKHFFGICLGMQTLFERSEECPGVEGLGIIPGEVKYFRGEDVVVPHIGWNGINAMQDSPIFDKLSSPMDNLRVYFVHSYRATLLGNNKDWVLTTTNYGNDTFISAIQKGRIIATQFHPEKSGKVGLEILKGFLESEQFVSSRNLPNESILSKGLAKRIIACLDVRTNDNGDLVVTKGDQYDVRENTDNSNDVRNLGKPVDLCERYYKEGADEVIFLNICSFRNDPIGDLPMIGVLKAASERVFVPLTVGGGIRAYTDVSGKTWSALHVAEMYFRAGADKVSIGTEAVYASERYYTNGKKKDGSSLIEQISQVYGKQAVVISIDPRRVYLRSKDNFHQTVVELSIPGPNGEKYCWYQATIRGGREGRDIDACQVAQACEALGAGELLLNCVDMDGQKAGYDHALISTIKSCVNIPVIASSGAGLVQHFSNVFRETNCEAALAAGIFHRNEVSIQDVKTHLSKHNIPVRQKL